MKTFKLKILLALFTGTGLLLSCSSDDENLSGNDPITPEPRSGSTQTVEVDLSFTAELTSFAESSTCGTGLYLYQHSGEGNSSVTGDYIVDISFCGQPDSYDISNISMTLHNAGGHQLFLSQRQDSGLPGGNEGPFNPGDEDSPDTEVVDASGANEGFIFLEVTGGTGPYNGVQGEFSARVSSVFRAGNESGSFNFTGYLKGL